MQEFIMGDFSVVFQNITTKSIKTTENVIKKSVFDLTSAIIQDTPVDSGRLRANWLVSFNTPIDAELKLEDKDGNATIAKAKALIGGSKVPLVYWINNNLPYANHIEYGGSKLKAPQGMVRINILRFNKHLQANLKGL